ncbi:inorganic diphosphatase [Pinibacter aurantiacus]|uniref:Inorganic diphosphatase n=1 Tax=Pinibacter aurantiacus TaxID=2851599 RepID=A0A9E2W8U4_9BACT|nr:inorganic diphosphatase [Pinibacter aurantiacus]MBV4358697.1 inorganic diphosphatase [Pinibacter aurantiacus]
MKIDKIPYKEHNLLKVVVETPKGSQHKYDFDFEYKVFKLKKTLPLGSTFPFDFGFVPGTKGEDGDPLDVLIIMEEASFPGCLIDCRIIGILEAEQTEKGGKPIRNDRIVAIANASILFKGITSMKELNENFINQIEDFFIDYNKSEQREFRPIRWSGSKKAWDLIEEGLQTAGSQK